MARVMFDPENDRRAPMVFPRLDMRSDALRQKQERTAKLLRERHMREASELNRKAREDRAEQAIEKAVRSRQQRTQTYEALLSQVVRESAEELKRLIRRRVDNKQLQRITRIQYQAVRIFNLTLDQLNGDSRIRRIAFAKQFVMYWACRMTGFSLPRIGRLLGDRDHTTVLHGCKAYASKRRAMKPARFLRPAR